MAVDMSDGQGDVTFALTTCSKIRQIFPADALTVPNELQAHYRNATRKMVDDFRRMPCRTKAQRFAFREQMRARLRRMMLAAALVRESRQPTAGALDHTGVRTMSSDDLVIRLYCPYGAAAGRLTIYPLFIFMLRHIATQLPALGISVADWTAELTALFYAAALGVAEQDLPKNASQFELSHPAVLKWYLAEVVGPCKAIA
jgi:hypothetical protein